MIQNFVYTLIYTPSECLIRLVVHFRVEKVSREQPVPISVDKLIKLTSQRCNNWNHIHIFPQPLIPSLIKHLSKIVPSIEWTYFWHRKQAILVSPFNIIDNHLLRSRIVSFTSDSFKLQSIWAAWPNDSNRYSLSDAWVSPMNWWSTHEIIWTERVLSESLSRKNIWF